MTRILAGLLFWAFAMSGFAQSDKQGEKLGVGDAVHVTVYQQADLTTDARISERGGITLPLVGEVKVAGMTLAEAGGKIGEALKEGKYLKNPQVSVTLTTLRSRQVSVLGMVARPGRYALDDTSSQLTEVIAAAGGVVSGGNEVAQVLRNGETHKVALLSKQFKLQNGDTVYIDRAPVFYVYGEVSRSGAYRLEDNMSVVQAIAASGGITPRGSHSRLKLRRTAADGKVVERDVGLQDKVKADDVIFVKEALF